MSKQTKYNLSFINTAAVFIVSYSNGQFKQLARKKGTLKQEQWGNLCKVIPTDEHHIKDIEEKYQGRVIYQKQDNKNTESQFKQFNAVYFQFFERETKLKPKFNATEGAALKQIINYLNDISASKEEAVVVWEQVLSNWSKLDDFYQKQMLVRQINSNLSIIINQLKNGGNKTNRAKRNADDLRESF